MARFNIAVCCRTGIHFYNTLNHILHAPLAARLAVIGLVTFLASCGTLKEAKMRVPTWFGMERIAPNVYASREVTDQQRAQLLASIAQARNQVLEVYGSVVSRPAVFACANRDCYESFNGHGDGKAFRDTAILLIPKSFIPEAISHEWAHVELYARVGRAGYRKIPMWFHEGLPVVISKLSAHSDDTLREAKRRGLPIPENIKELEGLKVWSKALRQYSNAEGLNVMYSAAGHEVRAWLKRVGQRGLLDLIDAVNSGETFSAAYHRIAERAAPADENTSNPRLEADAQSQHAAQPFVYTTVRSMSVRASAVPQVFPSQTCETGGSKSCVFANCDVLFAGRQKTRFQSWLPGQDRLSVPSSTSAMNA